MIEPDIDFPSACKSHNIVRIMLLLDLTKPALIFTNTSSLLVFQTMRRSHKARQSHDAFDV